MRWSERARRSWWASPVSRGRGVVTSGNSSTRWLLAIRRDWVDGTHEFVGPAEDLAAAARWWRSQHGKWRGSPYRPVLSIVVISGHDFWLHAEHRPRCAAPDCPVPARAVAV